MKSIWKDHVSIKSYDSLAGNASTDVLIIGGGMAGILCAYMLKKAGIDYILVEAERIGSKITGNTTAKITSQHGFIYSKLIHEFGVEAAKLYMRANEEALQHYRELCSDIDCDFEEKSNYVYTFNSSRLYKEYSALEKLGVSGNPSFPDISIEKNLSLPFPTAGAVSFTKQAQFNPLRFVSGIADGLHIYENTPVRELICSNKSHRSKSLHGDSKLNHDLQKGITAVTDYGRVTANKVIVATHFPFLNKHGSYFIKLYQQRSYVIALKNASIMDGMYVDEASQGLSFRNYGDFLLLGGGGHRTGKRGGGWQELRSFSRQYFPTAVETAHWAAQDCISLDGIPYIGNYSANTENLYVSAGFNKWGMSSSMVAALLLSDLIQGNDNPYKALFNPSRTIFRPSLAVNAAEAVVSLITPTRKRCPHLGCAIKWNPQEHSWDCPCHGSRFTQNGTLLDNPATGDMKL